MGLIVVQAVDSQLRLVVPMRLAEDGTPGAYAYHTTISFQTFEANYRALAATKAALFAQGPRYAFEVGAQIAALTLRDAGRKDSADRLDVDASGNPSDGGVGALIADLHRLTTVAVPAASGWEQAPLDVAIQRGALDADDVREVEGALVFFTCVWFLTPRAQRKAAAGVAASVARGSITSLSVSDWIASLPRSTAGIASPATA